MNDYIVLVSDEGQPYISHYGIKGQKWGYRRYQNADGSLTPEGLRRYGTSVSGNMHRALSKVYDLNARTYDRLGNKALASMNRAAQKQQLEKADAADLAKRQRKEAKMQTTPKVTYKDKLKEQNYQRYSKSNLPGVAIGKHFVDNAKYWKKTIPEIGQSEHKVKSFVNAYLDQPLHVSGLTGTADTTLRKRLTGKFKEFY